MSMLGIQIAMTALSAASSLQQGRDAAAQANFDRQQTDLQINQEKITSLQKMNLRNQQFSSNESINRATFFSGLNRDASDRSFKAFMQKQRELLSKDLEAVEGQTVSNISQLNLSKSVISMKANQAKQASLLGAGSAIASGLYRYDQYKIDKGLYDKDDS